MTAKNITESKVKRKRVALVTKFAIIIGISITYSVFFVAAYNIYASSPIIEQYKLDKDTEFNSISNLIHNEYKNIYFSEGISGEFEKLVYNLIQNNLVLHVGIVDKETNRYIWSSDEQLKGNKVELDSEWGKYQFKEHFKINKKNIGLKTSKFEKDNYILTISFVYDRSILNLVKVLENGNYMLGFTFIIFGVLSASILARQVTKPIEALVVGVWEFSKGNLDYRTTINTDDEIGILGKAFNYMAEKLNELYTSLEQKVKQRTAQLSSKNEELNKAYDELKHAQALLVHNEKMRSLGELVAGVAHELNNPINFIYGNMTHLRDYSENLIEIISKYEEIEISSENSKIKEINEIKDDIDYEFLKEDILALIQSCIEGAERSKNIVLELKNFSRLDQGVVKEIDVNESIDSTLNILGNKYKNKTTIYREYGEIPKLNCYAGQLNQVFMNILDNAAQAIQDSGDVTIRTKQVGEDIVVEIEDTGSGIDPETLPKIFDPFFTTKEVGSGSGMGLSITYKIVKSHNGNIDVESEIGKGTKFIVTLPLNWEPDANENSEEKDVETSTT